MVSPQGSLQVGDSGFRGPNSGWFLQQIQQPSERVLDLSGGPLGGGGGLLHSRLVPGIPMVVPPLHSDWESSEDAVTVSGESSSGDPNVEGSKLVANNQVDVPRGALVVRQQGGGPRGDFTMAEVAFDRMEIIRCALKSWWFSDKVNQIIFEEFANRDANGIWRRFFSWCSGLSRNPLTRDLSVLSEFLDSRSGEIRRERGETIRKRVLEVWGVVDGSYLKSIDPSKIVLRSFQRGAPRYNETYDIGPVLKRMDELWDIGSRKSVRALLIMVIKLQTLERSMSISKVRIEDLNVRVGFFKYLGMKGDKKDRLTGPKEICV